MADRWGIRTAADALEPRDPPRWIVDGLLREATLGMMYGAPGSLKSMLLADLAVTMAHGGTWLGEYECRMSTVLWVDMDNGTRRTGQRFGALLRGHGANETTPLLYTSMPVPPLDASSDAHMWALGDIVDSYGVDAVIVDNLGLVCGAVAENASEMAGIMGRWRRLVEQTGVAVVLIHHQRKSQSSGENQRRGDAVRGHSSIEAALDLALHVDRQGTENTVTITATKVRDYLRSGVFGARFRYVHMENSRELAAASFEGVKIQTAAEQQAAEINDRITEALRTRGAVQQQELVNVVRDGWAADPPGINRVREAIRQRVADGDVVVREAGRSLVYMLR